MKYGVWVAHHFRALALFAALWVPTRWILERGFTRPGLGEIGKVSTAAFPLLFLWLGQGLLHGRNGFRRAAIVLCSALSAWAVYHLLRCLVAPANTGAVFLETPAKPPFLTALEAGFLLALTAPPLGLLLAPATRRVYMMDLPFPPRARAWGHRRVLGYALAATILSTLAATYQSSLVRNTTTISLISAHPAEGSALGLFGEEILLDGKNRDDQVVWWIAAETRVPPDLDNPPTGYTEENYLRWWVFTDVWAHLSRHPSLPQGPPVLTLGLPGEPENEPNVFLYRRKTGLIRLDRRVRGPEMEEVKRIFDDARSLEDFRARIERFLPPLPRNGR